MVPAAYVRVERWPLTASGKVDRRALPAPEVGAFATQEYEAPFGEAETALAAIWASVLGVARVGRHDDFFALGGHSLLAVTLLERLQQLSAQITLADLFDNPTIRGLAQVIERVPTTLPKGAPIPIRTKGKDNPLFLIHELQGTTWYARVLAPHIERGIPIYALPEQSDAARAFRTIEGIGAALVRAIRTVRPMGPYRVAGWSFGGILAYEVARQLIGDDEAVEFLGIIDSALPLLPNVRHSTPRVDLASSLIDLLRPETKRDTYDQFVNEANGKDFLTLVQRAKELSLLPWDVTPEALEERIRHDWIYLDARDDYAPQPLPILTHLFLSSGRQRPHDWLGWEKVLPRHLVQPVTVPGTHTSMCEPENIGFLGKGISKAIREGQPSALTATTSEAYRVRLQVIERSPLRLCCVPGAGAPATAFSDLSAALGEEWSVYGLQPRGLDGVGRPHTSVNAAAAAYSGAFDDLPPRSDLHLLGHSFGGWVAFAMALRWQKEGTPPASLMLIDVGSPDSSFSVKECHADDAFLQLVEIVELGSAKRLGIHRHLVVGADEQTKLQLLHRQMVQADLLPQRSTFEVLRGVWWTFREALRTAYVPSDVYRHPVHLILVPDSRLSERENRARYSAFVDGWRRWAPDLTTRIGGGNHVTVLKQPHVSTLVQWLSEGARQRHL